MASQISAHAQERQINLEYHDQKPYFFGITLGVNSARFHTQMHSQFLSNDSVMVAEPTNSGGFSLGLSATARISDRFQVRFNPQLSFMERSIYYKLQYPEGGETEMTKTVESTNVSFPFQVKLISDRIGNFRVYLMGGFKADLDLASNARAKKAEDLVKIKSFDFGPELGIGFSFYFPSFILSPELKISNGLPNLHSRDAQLKYSSVFDKIQSRQITFSIHIEG
ncbi:MAG: PorT family protein [Chitinophagaceae bacterium]|nr:PorT family protein [Chitinophagaceae bacterium]